MKVTSIHGTSVDTGTRFGLTSFDLKIIALIFMTLDHIYAYVGLVRDAPVIFGILGRISAPLFLFTMAEGFYYTHNRKNYLIRMYLASVLMGIGNSLVNKYANAPEGVWIVNGIFATMFLIGLYICAIEDIKNGISIKDGKKLF